MVRSLVELEAIVREKICKACDLKQEETGCAPDAARRCSLFDLFPLVAQAVHATDSDDIQDYINAIRENVCSVCVDQKLDGTCDLRGESTCALDTYMPQVIEAIREATGKTFGYARL